MAYPTITPLPAAPNRNDPDNFSTEADAFVAALPALVTETNTAGVYTEGQAAAAAQSVTDAAAEVVLAADEVALAAAQVALATTQAGNSATSAGEAAASAAAAVVTANADLWVSGASYSAGDNVISEVDFGTYRSITTHTGVATDPSADETNWVIISASSAASSVAALTTSAIPSLTPAAIVDISLATEDYYKVTLDQNTAFTVSNVTAGFDEFGLGITGVDVAGAGYDLANASYDSVGFPITAQDAAPTGLAFSSDGTKMFSTGGVNKTVNQYTLGTAWDVSTASLAAGTLLLSGQEATPECVTLSTDGTMLFTVGYTNDTVYRYTLTTAWDVSTGSYDSISFSVTSQSSVPRDVKFSTDGTKMFVLDNSTDSIYQYSLSTAWNVSTASYDSVSFSVNAQEAAPEGIVFSADGTKMFMTGSNVDSVHLYILSTGFDLSTASYSSPSFSVANQETAPRAVVFKTDGTKMFIVGNGNDTVYQYTTNLPIPATISFPASFDFPAGTPDAPAAGVTITIKGKTTDGGTNWVVTKSDGGASLLSKISLDDDDYFTITLGDDTAFTLSNVEAVDTFNLAVTGFDVVTGYEVSNASYDSVSFSVTSQDTSPLGIAFSTEGTKMFMVGSANGSVFQYTLSTGFDLSTASYDSVSFSVASEDGSARDITFNTDGTKLYYLGSSTDSVHQYTLSTGFDLSTASYDSVSLDVSGQETNPTGITFNTDGTKMFVGGYNSDSVHQYTLSTGFDLSTASYDSVSLDVSGQDSLPRDIAFNTDGTKMYMVGSTGDSVYQYTLTTGFDLSTASYDSVSFSVSGQDAEPRDITFNTDGTKMYMVGITNDTVYQYTTSIITLATTNFPASFEFTSGATPAAPANGVTDILEAQTTNGGATWIVSQFGSGKATSYQDAVVVLTGATPTVNLAAAGEYRLTTSGNTTFTVSNPPADGYTTTKTLRITQGGTAYSLTFWAGIEFVGGTVPAAPAISETKEYTLRASTVSGTTIYVLTDTGVVS
jgi:6-phosphogluconolactonase (cycloisomerase 2 family)